MKRELFVAAAVLLLAACGKSGNSGQTNDQRDIKNAPTFSALEANILEPKCAHCHSGAKPAGKLDLTSYDAIAKSDDVKSGDPEASSLYQLVASGKMPKKAPALSAAEIQEIHDWILAGLPRG